ncbi:dihydrofolate reductase family protein [Agrococcus sp. HG114]|uniref:dihydrofolate reductase family protein n=1 Tax=Agrococcus sp. HG114 TaxID=2969757 RepID=UPI00215A25A2|nr:dihydrofolate reductase family protein [Agrococcus sp. HG114]MCR8670955.1 dihydrofolate reductase family protein [Agrococcus sp. HG114]
MGRIVFDTAATINGFLADDAHSLDWLFAVPGGDAPDASLLPQGATVMVLGSHTYEWMLRAWRGRGGTEQWQEFAGERPLFVFSSRELPLPEGADVRFLRGAVAEALPELRAAAGDGDIWVVGGGDLAGQFLDAGALDEIAISIAPVALPSGAPLLPRRVGSDRLALVEVRQVGQFARLVLRVGPAAAPMP